MTGTEQREKKCTSRELNKGRKKMYIMGTEQKEKNARLGDYSRSAAARHLARVARPSVSEVNALANDFCTSTTGTTATQLPREKLLEVVAGCTS